MFLVRARKDMCLLCDTFDMQNVVESVGYMFDKEYDFSSNRVSHFNRKNGVVSKKEYESMLVFRV